MRPAYRPDIDGLRAIAVLAVVFFHAGFRHFGGGFVGVDVFFVISGYLITQQLVSAKQVSLPQFYLRRARRLLPAMFVVLALCIPAAWCLLITDHLIRFGKSLASASLFTSNIFFWAEADYFDAESTFKPLLHTWSLGVEWQFYLLWPLALLWMLKRKWKPKKILTALAALAMLSFALNYAFMHDRSAVFYLLPFRVFEFAIGAALVWVKPQRYLELSCAAGLAMIAAAVVLYNDSLPFPGVYGLLPCIGAALVIYGGQAKYCGLLLRNRAAVGIGLISYSLYLVHWPALVLFKYYKFAPLGLEKTAIVLAASFGLATLLYFAVERPLHHGAWAKRQSASRVWGTSALTALALLLAGIFLWQDGGQGRGGARQAYSKEMVEAMQRSSCQQGYGVCALPAGPADIEMIGDSHITAMRTLLGTVAAGNKQVLVPHMTLACRALYESGQKCAKEVDETFRTIAAGPAHTVILVSSWNNYSHTDPEPYILDRLAHTISFLKKAGKQVYVYGSMPVMARSSATCFERPDNADCEEFMEAHNHPMQLRFNRELKETSLKHGARYFDAFADLCDESRCRVAYERLSLFASDRFHYNAKHFSAYMILKRSHGKNLTLEDLFLDH